MDEASIGLYNGSPTKTNTVTTNNDSFFHTIFNVSSFTKPESPSNFLSLTFLFINIIFFLAVLTTIIICKLTIKFIIYEYKLIIINYKVLVYRNGKLSDKEIQQNEYTVNLM